MKKGALILGVICILAACKKNASSPTTLSSNLVTAVSYKNAIAHSTVIFNLKYTSSQQIVQLGFYSYDTSSGVPSLDTGTISFAVNPSTNLPSSYTISGRKDIDSTVYVETHNLTFDNQGRMIKDTMVTGQSLPGDSAASYYFYANNLILCKGYSMYYYDSVTLGYGWGPTEVDSLTLNNGNLANQVDELQNGTQWVLDNSYMVNNYSSYANPLYTAQLSASLGAFFRIQNMIDCLSKNLPSDGISQWTTDASGKVVSGLGTDGTVINFTYP